LPRKIFSFAKSKIMKIAATVILYHPDNNLLQNIQSYAAVVEKLYIVDNTEKPEEKLIRHIREFKNTIYLHDGENKGIAARLNQVSELAITGGFDWLLTMDQDSVFHNGMLTNYLHCINNYPEKESVSMFGVTFSEGEYESGNCNPVRVNHLITSGSMVNLQLFPITSGFNEDLFIDEVDFEYCLRSVARGFNIIQLKNIFLSHHLGETSQHRSLKTSKITSRVLHSPRRIYYMTRNFLYVQSKYKETFPEEINLRRKILLNRIKNNILYNKQRLKVIRYALKGFTDYKKNRMGN
jgi:rhamnosyltransferase